MALLNDSIKKTPPKQFCRDFFADQPTAAAEQEAFAKAIGYLHQHAHSKVYYYSKYERTLYRKLQAKYPDVCTAEEIESLFDPERAIDLYFDVVLKATEWPTRDYSIKSLAKYLGFIWRDTHPSGAASIEWFHRWVESGDLDIKQRILDYNEDDCRATRVLLRWHSPTPGSPITRAKDQILSCGHPARRDRGSSVGEHGVG